MKRKLGPRLETVASMVTGATVADIGSDHGFLLTFLLQEKRIRFGIAIEKNLVPMQRSREQLSGLAAVVRHADGLAGLEADEAECLVMSGMGGELMARIFSHRQDVIPSRVVLQPNTHLEVIRKWMFEHGYAIEDERVVQETSWYTVMKFERTASPPDPAYHGLSKEVAFTAGPHLLRRRSPEWLRWLESEVARLRSYPKLNSRSEKRLAELRSARVIRSIAYRSVVRDRSA
ncbi:MAG: class I SAM-dependent methyltransferase [Planctomycetota bacterium]